MYFFFFLNLVSDLRQSIVGPWQKLNVCQQFWQMSFVSGSAPPDSLSALYFTLNICWGINIIMFIVSYKRKCCESERVYFCGWNNALYNAARKSNAPLVWKFDTFCVSWKIPRMYKENVFLVYFMMEKSRSFRKEIVCF